VLSLIWWNSGVSTQNAKLCAQFAGINARASFTLLETPDCLCGRLHLEPESGGKVEVVEGGYACRNSNLGLESQPTCYAAGAG